MARPFTEPTKNSLPFWQDLNQGKLLLQRCRDCGGMVFYPREACPHCASDSLEWIPVEARGTLYSYTVVRKASLPEFQQETPYVFAIVDLGEGVRMPTNMVNCKLGELVVGMPVRGVFSRNDSGRGLLFFEPEG